MLFLFQALGINHGVAVDAGSYALTGAATTTTKHNWRMFAGLTTIIR